MKPSTNRMLTRIKAVYVYIHEKGTVSTQQLVDEFGITPRTVQRDLNVLAFNGLVQSPTKGKWSTTEKKVRLSS
ncbi:MAG: DeoR family transcriptional regulator [Bacillota bacterium]